MRSHHLICGLCGAALVAALGCGGRSKAPAAVEPRPTVPLPVAGLAGQQVSLFPLTLIAAEPALNWGTYFPDRRTALASADSVITGLIVSRVPEVVWLGPEELQRAARRSAGVVPDPHQLATALLRAEQLVMVPDPLRSQLRTLVAIAGGRYAVIPAAVVYRGGETPAAPPPTGSPADSATAELSIVVVDVRVGKVDWRTVARGTGADPWSALTRAVKGLTPGLP